MKCPSCQHVSKEAAPKFCSQCGARLPSAAPLPDSENNPKVASASEGEMECGLELKAEGGPFLSPGTSDRQRSLDEPCAAASWDTCQSKKKRRRRKRRGASASAGPYSLPARPTPPSGPDSLANPGFQDAARPRQSAQQGGPPGQPSPDPGAGAMPADGALQSHPTAAPKAAPGGPSPSSPASEDQELRRALPEAGSQEPPDIPQEGAGLTASACGGGPGKEDRAQDLPLPESQGDHAEPRKDPQAAGQPAEAAPSGVVDAAAQLANPEKGTEEEVTKKTQKSERPPASAAAPSGRCQEAETKDKTAAAGGKAKPEKPEGSARSHADAAKPGKEQRDRKAGAQQVKDSPLNPGEGVMVFFHAIISKDFKFDCNRHQIFIKGGEELGKPKWIKKFCEMTFSKDLGQHGTLVEGSGIISRQHLDKPIPYKYVLSRGKGSDEYEFIYKQQKEKHEHVNRCLRVKAELLGPDADWHQYDDIVCMKPPGMVQKFFNTIWDTSKWKLVKGKQLAAGVMLDRVFSVLQTWNAINLKNFFAQLKQFYFVVHEPIIYEGDPQLWSELQYGEKEVKKDLWDHLAKQMAPFQEGSGDPLPQDQPVKSKLRMGLIVLNLVESFDFPLSPDDLALLCTLLCSSASSPDDFRRDLSHIFETSQSWRTWLVDLCQRSMDMKVDLWVGTLPVLHHCMELPPPRRDARIQSEDSWAALEGISFSEFRERRADPEQLLRLMEEKQHLLRVDEHLFRSWFSLLPLSHLASYMGNLSEYLSCFPSRVLDCLLGTCYRLQGLKELSKVNLEDIKKVLQKLLHLLDIYQDKILEEPLVQSYLTVCLNIHEAICRLTKDPAFYEMPALSAEIVCRIILNTVAASAEGQGNNSGKTSVGTVIQAALTTTRKWHSNVFRKGMFQAPQASPVKFTYQQEIQIWRRLVEINFPREHGWKETLLADMEGRLFLQTAVPGPFSAKWD